jgi:hypothetical protein
MVLSKETLSQLTAEFKSPQDLQSDAAVSRLGH